eukprot:m.36302 g.36302  ORF g.36302 m.36302 type:complete len:551 (+) comp9080_c0_seq2:285-1937(+)
MDDKRKRWSRPPAKPIGLAPHPPQRVMDIVYGDTMEDQVLEEEEEEEQLDLTAELEQMKLNFRRLAKEKESMQDYCEEMVKTVESREEMLAHLKSQNLLLSHKLGKTQQEATAKTMELEKRLNAEQTEVKKRKKVLPKAPGPPRERRLRNNSHSEEEKRGKKDDSAELLAEIAQLKSRNQKLQDTLDSVDMKLVTDIEDLKRQNEELQLALDDAKCRNDKLRDTLDELSAEKEELTERVNRSSVERANNIDNLDDSSQSNNLNDSLSAELEAAMENQGESMSLSAELEAAMDVDVETPQQVDVSTENREQPKKFKGMTVDEQAGFFQEYIQLKMEIDEIGESLVIAKAQAAKAQWRREHERLYTKNRNRILLRILQRPLSTADRLKVIRMLEETDLDAEDKFPDGDEFIASEYESAVESEESDIDDDDDDDDMDDNEDDEDDDDDDEDSDDEDEKPAPKKNVKQTPAKKGNEKKGNEGKKDNKKDNKKAAPKAGDVNNESTDAILEKVLKAQATPKKQKGFTNYAKHTLKLTDDKKIEELWGKYKVAKKL